MRLNTETVQAIAERFGWEWCAEYGEPGYSTSREDGILFGNYNGTRIGGPSRWGNGRDVWIDRHPRIMEQLGDQYELEWSDEWTIDYDYGKAYRTQPDSYSWQPSTMWTEGGYMLTPDDDLSVWTEEVQNDPKRALMGRIWSVAELGSAGWEQWAPGDPQTYETGWHPGQNDNPAAVYDAIRADLGQTVDILFRIDGTGQFDVSWSCFVRDVDHES